MQSYVHLLPALIAQTKLVRIDTKSQQLKRKNGGRTGCNIYTGYINSLGYTIPVLHFLYY